MQTHTVFFWLKSGVSEKEISTFQTELKKLIQVEPVNKAYLGQAARTEIRPVVDHSFHYSITLLFNNIEDHNAYQDHPSHHEFIEKCSPIWEKVIVYDSEIILNH
ncbi:MAG: Dabb family protein [SAR324 cluster bacterium]|nr:Dabb family protein [SAR324 cluster bacterium]